VPVAAPSGIDRRAKFREWMRRLDPVGDLAGTPEALVLPRPDPVGQTLASSLEIRPQGTHLVLGTIGSGKTTELRDAARRLQAADPELTVVVADLSALNDVGEVGEGALGLAAAWFLADHTAAPARARKSLDSSPATAPTTAGFRRRAPAVRDVLREVAERSPAGVVLFLDGFDRACDAESFRALVRSELPLFREHGIGLVLTAPPDLRFTETEVEGAWFERIHACGAFHPIRDQRFLLRVLEHRVPGALTAEAQVLACRASGGVLRDLVAVARTALEDAWVSGADTANHSAVSAAGVALGRTLLADAAMAELFRSYVPEHEHGAEEFPALKADGWDWEPRLFERRLLLAMRPHEVLLHPAAVQVDEIPF
jgi:hypothetical protein